MNVIFMLVGFSLLAALFFLGSFIWAVKNGQYDDDYTPSVRMLFDDEDFNQPKSETNHEDSQTRINSTKTVNN